MNNLNISIHHKFVIDIDGRWVNRWYVTIKSIRYYHPQPILDYYGSHLQTTTVLSLPVDIYKKMTLCSMTSHSARRKHNELRRPDFQENDVISQKLVFYLKAVF